MEKEMKRKLLVVIVVVLALVLVVGVTILPKLDKRTPSQKVVLTASDLTESGWRQTVIGEVGDPHFRAEDSCESTMKWDNSTGMQAAIIIELYHFNSSEAAQVEYNSLLSGYSALKYYPRNSTTIENVTVEQILVGDGGFYTSDLFSIPGMDTVPQAYLVKGSYLACFQIGWNHSFGWTNENVTQIMKIQADKLP